MTLLSTFKEFISSEYIDDGSDDQTLYSYHPQLRALLMFNGIFLNKNSNSKWRFLLPALSIALSLVATVFELMFIYHGLDIKDYEFATENFVYFMVLSTVPIVYTCVLLNVDKIKFLLKTMNNDFLQVCKLGPRYRIPFLSGQLIIRKLCIAWFVFCVFVVMVFVILTLCLLVFQSLFATQTENTIRPLIFPMWLPEDDPYRTPNYEVFMFLQIAICLIVVLTFCVYVYILFHNLLHIYNMMNMIILDFEVIFEGLNESVIYLDPRDEEREKTQRTLNKRMGRVVIWHKSVLKTVATISSVYGPPLVYQVGFSSIALCLMMYFLATRLDEGQLHLPFAVLFVATCVQLWIPCYLGTLIRNKAFAVGEACFNSGWQTSKLGRLLRMDIIIVILITQQPVTIKFTGLPDVQLETFSAIMSNAYSYFNMLRQAQLEK